MRFLFKMQKTLVTFSLTSIILRWGYLILQNFQEMQKGTWYLKTFEEHSEIRKIKIHIRTVWLLTCSQALNMKKDKVQQVPQQNEMLSLYCTAIGFISKNEEYNPK